MREKVLFFVSVFVFLASVSYAETPGYTGIGARFGELNTGSSSDTHLKSFGVQIKVTALLANGPAAKAGLKENDPVVRVEVGERVFRMASNTIAGPVEWLKKNQPGVQVVLTVLRRDAYGFLREKSIVVTSAVIDSNWAPYNPPPNYDGGM